MSSPMLEPWLTPDSNKVGRSRPTILFSAINTQSVGVPSMVKRLSPSFFTRRGRLMVNEWPAAERSESGATTQTSSLNVRAIRSRTLNPSP